MGIASVGFGMGLRGCLRLSKEDVCKLSEANCASRSSPVGLAAQNFMYRSTMRL
jgi:hypothetical protein